MSLSIRRGQERILVWRRGRWESMPHLTTDLDARGGADTLCGRRVLLGEGVDAMVITSIPADLFIVRGCGSCSRALLRDLRAETEARMADAKGKLRKLLDEASWTWSSTEARDELAARRSRRNAG